MAIIWWCKTSNMVPTMTLREDIATCLVKAIQLKASDIYLTKDQQHICMLFRMRSSLVTIKHLEKDTLKIWIQHLKILLNFGLHQEPVYEGQLIHQMHYFRVSILDHLDCQQLHIRCLLPIRTLDAFKISTYAISVLLQHIKARGCHIIIFGHPGSGKTTLLSALIRLFSNMNQLVISLEDPIEIHQTSNPQIVMDEHTQVICKAILRQRYDGVAIGEVRDNKSIHAAQTLINTGHTCFFTIHGDSLSQCQTRLKYFNIQPMPPNCYLHLQNNFTITTYVEHKTMLRFDPELD